MDRKTPPAERAATLIDALAGFDTDTVFLPPKVRETLAARRTERQAPRSRPKPRCRSAGRRQLRPLKCADAEPSIYGRSVRVRADATSSRLTRSTAT